jgi:hypothetical protein
MTLRGALASLLALGSMVGSVSASGDGGAVVDVYNAADLATLAEELDASASDLVKSATTAHKKQSEEQNAIQAENKKKKMRHSEAEVPAPPQHSVCCWSPH